MQLHDISADGRVLISSVDARVEAFCMAPGDISERPI